MATDRQLTKIVLHLKGQDWRAFGVLQLWQDGWRCYLADARGPRYMFYMGVPASPTVQEAYHLLLHDLHRVMNWDTDGPIHVPGEADGDWGWLSDGRKPGM